MTVWKRTRREGAVKFDFRTGCCHEGWGSAFMTKSLLAKPAVVVVSAKGPVVEAMERSTEDVIVESGQVVRPRGLMRQASLNRALSR